jgi:small-conductance mechanosensitive channel
MTNLVEDIAGPVRRVLDYPVFPSSGITVASLLALVLLFGLVVLAERVVRRYFITRLLGRTHLEPAMQFALARVVGYALLALGFFISLQMVGVNLTSLSFLAGAVGVGFGFGLQNIISNFISGLIILAERPIKIGDRVEIGGVAGQVREISLRSTTVVTNDNMAIIVPNANFITQQVTNWSYEDPRVRFRIPFGVAHGTDLPTLRKLMMEVAAGHPKVLKEPKPELFCIGITEDGLNFELAVWSSEATTSPRQFRSDLFFAIDQKLRENAIKLPAPPQPRP